MIASKGGKGGSLGGLFAAPSLRKPCRACCIVHVGTGTWRAGAFVALALWIFGAPFVRQVLGEHSPYLNRWAMYSRATPGLVEVRYSSDAAGRKRLSHYRLLGYTGRSDTPLSVWRITSLTRAEQIGLRLCALGGSGATVYLRARRAGPAGFVLVADGQRDLCGDHPSASQRGRPP